MLGGVKENILTQPAALSPCWAGKNSSTPPPLPLSFAACLEGQGE